VVAVADKQTISVLKVHLRSFQRSHQRVVDMAELWETTTVATAVRVAVLLVMLLQVQAEQATPRKASMVVMAWLRLLRAVVVEVHQPMVQTALELGMVVLAVQGEQQASRVVR